MKTKILNHQHHENGIGIQLVPETEIEEGFLRGLFMHGKMEMGHPCGEFGLTGFYLSWKQNKVDGEE